MEATDLAPNYPVSGSWPNASATHMMDPELHDFKNAKATGIADPNGDMAFDHEEMPVSATLPGLQVVQLS
jgi:hypothetical protein